MEQAEVINRSRPSAGGTPLSALAKAAREKLHYRAVFEGTFQRFDGSGQLIETLPSRIKVDFDPRKDEPYTQVNRYQKPDGTCEEVVSTGEWSDGMLHFRNHKVSGVSSDLNMKQDPYQRSAMLHIDYHDGSNITMYEIIAVSPDGKTRSRVAQYDREGVVIRRTLIDEVKVEENFSEVA